MAIDPKVCVLLASYNGERFIRQQIASIQNQTITHWRLLVSDDGSSDDTLPLLRRLAAGDARIEVLAVRPAGGSGALGNFRALFEAALEGDEQLFFCCDQDDVWEPDKLALQIAQFPEMGAEALPRLVHSDLRVVDANLDPLAPSLVRHMGLAPNAKAALDYLLSRNFVTGCATACNRALLQRAVPIPDTAIMHDWWLALVAAACGEIVYLDRPLVNYRQHGTNTLGAKSIWHGLNPRRNWVVGWRAGNREFLATFEQARALYQRMVTQPGWPAASVAKVNAYQSLLEHSPLARVTAARALQLRQGSALLQLIYYTRLLTVSGAS